jgi:uncharacterized protein (DUF2252 family)
MKLEAANGDLAPEEPRKQADDDAPPAEVAEGTAPREGALAPPTDGAPQRTDRERRRAPARRVEHPTPGERAARGKAARAEVPRSSHAEWQPAADRPDPVAVLDSQARTRVPELVPIRYGRMLVSPFTFFRGAAAIMAGDLAPLPRSGLVAQLCGDAHLSNFGTFAAPDRKLVFSLNDFDETLPGPFEWDVKRLSASFAVAGRALGHDETDRRAAVAACARSYRAAMQDFSTMRAMDIWYLRLDVSTLVKRWGAAVSKKRLKVAKRNVARAETKDSLRAFGKLTEVVDGKRRIISSPPSVVPVEDLLTPELASRFHEIARAIVRSYRRSLPRDRRKLLERFEYVHAARKVVGVGSVGTRAWVVLLTGRDGNDPLFLQLKEAQASVLEPHLGKSPYANSGQRVVEGQRMMQSASDLMLGWDRTTGIDGVQRDFYVRQLWDAKGSALVETMDPRTLSVYGEICGWTLARAHARSGDPIGIASYLGTGSAFDEAMASFAESYADQNERDYAALQEAVTAGRIVAQTGI